MYDAVAIGELLADLICREKGSDGYPVLEAHPGGAPANFLAAIAKCGGRTAMLGKVGDDAFGRLLTGTLDSCGIDRSGIVVSKEFFTTLAFVTLDEKGNREFSFARKPGADTQLDFRELRLELIDNARLLHFGSLSLTGEPSRSAVKGAVEYARARGRLVSFDPNYRPPLWTEPEEAKKQMLWGLSMADVVKLSDEEGQFLFGLGAEDCGRHIVEEFGAGLVFVTCGESGCFFANPGAQGHVDGLRSIRAVDTTGAGDIFGGCAVWKLLQTGKRPEKLDARELNEIAAFACRVAGLSTERPGGISSIPDIS